MFACLYKAHFTVTSYLHDIAINPVYKVLGKLVQKLGCVLWPSIFAQQNLKITILAELIITVIKSRKGQ